MRHGNPCIGRRPIAGGYSRHDLIFDPGFPKLPGFLSASSEDKRISAFETDHMFAFLRPPDQKRIGLFLFQMVIGRTLSGVDQLCVLSGFI